MNLRALIGSVLLLLLISCRTCSADNIISQKLNFILLGYDSLAAYYGGSDTMSGLKYGKLSDAVFMQEIIKEAKKRNSNNALEILLKPTASANVGADLTDIRALLNMQGLMEHSIDTLNEKESLFFNRQALQAFTGKNLELELPLPKEENKPSAISRNQNRLTLLLFGKGNIYAYRGSNMETGKWYTDQNCKELLAGARKIFVSIKPSEKAHIRRSLICWT